MPEILFWLYLVNSVLLINHEIDSAFWKEWDLFHLPGGISGFLWIHFPLLFVILYGLVRVFQGAFDGLLFSLLLSSGGVFAFVIHMVFIKKGNKEINVDVSMNCDIGTLNSLFPFLMNTM